jgi:hypothetical protein
VADKKRTSSKYGVSEFREGEDAAYPDVVLEALDKVRLAAQRQGLTYVHFRAQLEDLRDTSLTFELNLSTFGTRLRINLGHMGDKVSLR